MPNEINPDNLVKKAAVEQEPRKKTLTLDKAVEKLEEDTADIFVVITSTSPQSGNTAYFGGRFIRLKTLVELPKKLVNRIAEWRNGSGTKMYSIDYIPADQVDRSKVGK